MKKGLRGAPSWSRSALPVIFLPETSGIGGFGAEGRKASLFSFAGAPKSGLRRDLETSGAI